MCWSKSYKRNFFVVTVSGVIVNLGAGNVKESAPSRLHLLHSRTFDIEVNRTFFKGMFCSPQHEIPRTPFEGSAALNSKEWVG